MKVGILSACLSHKAGGIYEVMRRSAQELQRRYISAVEVFGLEDERCIDDLRQWDELPLHVFRGVGPKSFCYSPDLFSGVLRGGLDLLHVHGIWTYTSIVGSRWAAETGRPLLISPHGMLDPWPLSHRRWKKQVADFLYEGSHLRRAACIHALSRRELDSIRAYGLSNPVAVIPTGIDVPEVSTTVRTAGETRTLLYLGRLHAVKGLVNLLHGWSEYCGRNGRETNRWRLVLAGWDDGGHGEELKALSRELGLETSVSFAGPKFGEEKHRLLSESHAFVLPSLSEGLPVGALEAMAYGLPLIMTPECNLLQAFSVEAAVQIAATPDSIAEGIHRLLGLDDKAREAIGTKGRQLVQKEFSWATVAAQFYSAYSWLVNGGPKPDCVYVG